MEPASLQQLLSILSAAFATLLPQLTDTVGACLPPLLAQATARAAALEEEDKTLRAQACETRAILSELTTITRDTRAALSASQARVQHLEAQLQAQRL